MKRYSRQVFGHTLLSFAVILPLVFNAAFAATKVTIVKIYSDGKTNVNKTISKLEIIAAVKDKYPGKIEILSIRKKSKVYGENCHYVKIIDTKGEFIEVHIFCKKK